MGLIIDAFTAWYATFAGRRLTDRVSLFRLSVGNMDPIYISWDWLPKEIDTSGSVVYKT